MLGLIEKINSFLFLYFFSIRVFGIAVTGLTTDLLFTILSSHYLDRKYTVYQFCLGQTNILHVHISQA